MSGLKGRAPTKFRQAFKAWEAGPGQQFIKHRPGRTNYLRPNRRELEKNNEVSDRPFPSNMKFQSQPVLSEELKEEVWKQVVQRGKSLRRASVDYYMDIRRVAAVVRLKQVEKQWIADVSLAISYIRSNMMRQPNRLVLKTSTWLRQTEIF